MALQDLKPINPASLIDPATGEPYPYGSPGYLAAVAPFLESQLRTQAEQANNARGTFYSGPAMANEQQAEEELLGNMTQAGAQQAVQEQELQQQEAFAQQMQEEQNQVNADAAKAAAKSAMLNSAIGGGVQSLGTLGALGTMKLLGFGNSGNVGTITVPMNGGGSMQLPATPENLAKYGSGTPTPSGSLDPMTDPNSFINSGGGADTAAAIEGAPSYELASAPAEAGLAGGEAGGAAGAIPASATGLSSLAPTALSLGEGALGAYEANQIGNSILGLEGNKPNLGSQIGSGIGGAVGEYYGGPLGATAGSFLGGQTGEALQNHPIQSGIAELVLPGLGPILSNIPAVSKFMTNAGNDIGNFFSRVF